MVLYESLQGRNDIRKKNQLIGIAEIGFLNVQRPVSIQENSLARAYHASGKVANNSFVDVIAVPTFPTTTPEA